MFLDLLDKIFDFLKAFFSKPEVIIFVGFLIIALVVALPSLHLWDSFRRFLYATWWLWTFIISYKAFESLWLFWRQELYQHSSEFKMIMLEIRMPREVLKSPQGMEHVLNSIAALRNVQSDPEEKYRDGEITRRYSLEMVSFGGEIHFYVRCYFKQRNLIEAAFFAYYPDLEIVEVEDYAEKLPKTMQELYDAGKDLWGTEMVLAREAAYPIKTYAQFFEAGKEEEAQLFDPISTFLEVLGKLHPEQFVGIQIILAPADREWYKAWEKLLIDLKEASRRKVEGLEGVIKEIARTRTPGETDVLREVERNLSKPAFETLIRFIYISPKELYYDSYPRRGVSGAFNQYGSADLNLFKQNYAVATRVRIWHKPYFFPNKRAEYRKQRILYNYRIRKTPPETFMGKLITSYPLNSAFTPEQSMLTTEAIATLFHPPTTRVLTAPHVVRVESHKAGPPAGLSIFGEEKEIEQYK